MTDFLNLLKLESKEINHLFEKASIEGKGTPQEVSDRREIVVKKFLQKYFPFPYRIAKGQIVDSTGLRSASIDCLLLNPSHPYTVSDDEKYSVIFADGVDVAIEVKPDLSKEEEIHRALKQIVTVKKLTRKRHGLLFTHQYTQDEINTAKKIPTFIFGNKTYKDIKLLIEKIIDYYFENKILKDEQFDFIVINHFGMIFNSKKGSYFHFNNSIEGIFYIELGEHTIASFLYWLNRLPQSEPRSSSPVLEHYLNFSVTQMVSFHDLNERLLSIQ
jgi:hypothetical protein